MNRRPGCAAGRRGALSVETGTLAAGTGVAGGALCTGAGAAVCIGAGGRRCGAGSERSAVVSRQTGAGTARLGAVVRRLLHSDPTSTMVPAAPRIASATAPNRSHGRLGADGSTSPVPPESTASTPSRCLDASGWGCGRRGDGGVGGGAGVGGTAAERGSTAAAAR